MALKSHEKISNVTFSGVNYCPFNRRSQVLQPSNPMVFENDIRKQLMHARLEISLSLPLIFGSIASPFQLSTLQEKKNP